MKLALRILIASTCVLPVLGCGAESTEDDPTDGAAGSAPDTGGATGNTGGSATGGSGGTGTGGDAPATGGVGTGGVGTGGGETGGSSGTGTGGAEPGTGGAETGGSSGSGSGGAPPSGDLCPGDYPAESGVFVAGPEGVIVIEVETHSPSGWTFDTAAAGYSGDGYLIDPGGGGTLSFQFQVDTPGTYRISVHNYITNANNTESNDVFANMDGLGDVKMFSHGLGQGYQWTWDIGLDPEGATLDPAYYAPPNVIIPGHEFIKPAGYVLDAGVHTFTMRARSSGFAIDRLHIYPDAMGEASGTNLALPQSGQINCL